MKWLLLSYRLPREPSTPRIALWRALRRLGAVPVLDGLAALPYDARSCEHFDWLAEDVRDNGGEASVWIGEATTRAQQRELEARVRGALAAEYQQVIDIARTRDHRAVARLRTWLERIDARDRFRVPERKQAHDAVNALTMEAA